jgi:protein involved in polysaccharide export with SLBB domain
MWYRVVLLLSPLLLAACSTPSQVALPDAQVLARHRIAPDSALTTPAAGTLRLQAGDTLRILRDAQWPRERDDASLFVVAADGGFAYPQVGRVQASGQTLDAVAGFITHKLAAIYREPQVTVNLASAAANQVFVGGAVRNAGAVELRGPLHIEQAILSAGGVLPSADSEHVALLRMNDAGRYDVYFYDFANALQPAAGGRPAVALQRGDIVFVAKSAIGNAVEGVDLYVNQLLPFSRSVGVSLNYGKDLRAIQTRPAP